MPDLLKEPTDTDIIFEINKKLKDSWADYESLKNYFERLTPELEDMYDLSY